MSKAINENKQLLWNEVSKTKGGKVENYNRI